MIRLTRARSELLNFKKEMLRSRACTTPELEGLEKIQVAICLIRQAQADFAAAQIEELAEYRTPSQGDGAYLENDTM